MKQNWFGQTMLSAVGLVSFLYFIQGILLFPLELNSLSESNARALSLFPGAGVRARKLWPIAAAPPEYSHLLIALGTGRHVKNWISQVTLISAEHMRHMNLIVGVTDNSAQALGCSTIDSSRVLCVSLPNQTWMSRRNTLIRLAFFFEKERQLVHTFWTFVEADTNLYCSHPPVQRLDCLVKYDKLLQRLPYEVMVVAVSGSGAWQFTPEAVMTQMKVIDGVFNSFRRDALHVLLPYSTERSEIFWYRLQCLAPVYAITPLYIFYGKFRNNQLWKENRAQQTEGLTLSGAPSDYFEEFRSEKVEKLPLLHDTVLFNATFQRCLLKYSRNFIQFVA